MQFRQQQPPSASNDAYWQQLDARVDNLKKRTRRQFLITSGGLLGGTALALGFMGAATQSFSLHLPTPGGQSGAASCASKGTPLSASNPEELKVCVLNKSINFFSFYVAQQEGYFKSEGLTITTSAPMQVGSKVVAGVESGGYDIGNGVITDIFTWAITDSSARIIGAFMDGYVVDIVASKQFEQEMQVSPTSPLSQKVLALKGKRIGITGPKTGTQALLTYLFRQQGMNAAQDVTQVSLGSNNDLALSQLQAGKVDALSFFSPIGQAAEAQGIGDIFISPVRGDVPGLQGDVHGICYTKQSIIDAKPQAIAAYIRAVNKAEVFIQNEPTQTKKLLNSYLGLGQSVTDAVYNAQIAGVARSPQISQSAYNVAGQFHVQAGLVSLIPSYNKLVATDTINSALGMGTAACN
jgi:ABC-type nitrate/sulfonate/bicarbonate transport system substrate-binding protein